MRIMRNCPNRCKLDKKKTTFRHWKYCPHCAAELECVDIKPVPDQEPERPYACPMDGCDKRYASTGYLENHIYRSHCRDWDEANKIANKVWLEVWIMQKKQMVTNNGPMPTL